MATTLFLCMDDAQFLFLISYHGDSISSVTLPANTKRVKSKLIHFDQEGMFHLPFDRRMNVTVNILYFRPSKLAEADPYKFCAYSLSASCIHRTHLKEEDPDHARCRMAKGKGTP